MFTWIIFLREGAGGNNCIENNGVAFSIKNGVTHIWDFRGKKNSGE